MRKIIFLLLYLTTIVCAQLPAQIAGFKSGKLPNGLSYYILNRDAGEGEVNFYLLQNVGAIVEEDNQNGLAHYLEHMAFNATRHFPDGVMNYLRGNGVFTFNATTGTNETTYSISGIPTSDTKLSDTCLYILKDWCDGISLNPDDVEKERSIIIEEWRVRGGLGRRMSDATAKAVYNNSLYAHRNVIGDVNVLKTFRAEDIERFYRTWYRPDLQAIIIVGDIDEKQYEEKVKKLFSTIPPTPASAPERKNTIIEDNAETLFCHFTDPENKTTSFGLYQRIPANGNNANPEEEQQMKENIYMMIFNNIVKQRFSRIVNANSERFIAATASIAPLERGYYNCDWDVVPLENNNEEALKQLLEVRQQIISNGFSDDEFRREQEALGENIRGMLKEQILGTPANYVDIFRRHFLWQMPIVDMKERMEENLYILLEMDVDDINQWIKLWSSNRNLSFVAYTADKKVPVISLERFNQLLNEVKSSQLSENKTTTAPIPDSFIDFEIKKGKIVKTKTIEELDGAQEWTLSNGARVIYKYLPDEKERFSLIAGSMGGASAVKTEDLPSFRAMKDLIMRSGLYNYDRNLLADMLRDKNFEVNLSINAYTEVVGGHSSMNDADAFFQYVYLILEKQKFDKAIFDKYIQRKKYLHQSTSISAKDSVETEIDNLLSPPSPRNRKPDMAFYNEMQFDRLLPLYKERFGNAADFTFCIVGGLDEKRAIALTESYLAALPSQPEATKETYRIEDFDSKEKIIERVFTADIPDDVGIAEISFLNHLKLTKKEEIAFILFGRILQNRLFEKMRQKSGNVYGVDVSAQYNAVPSPKESLAIRFQTERSKIDDLKSIFYDEMNTIKENGVTNEELAMMKAPMLMNYVEDADKDNVFPGDIRSWIGILNVYVENNGNIDIQDISEKEAVELLTSTDMTQIVRKILSSAYKRDIVLKSIAPEEKEWIH